MYPFDQFESLIAANQINLHGYMVYKDGMLMAKKEYEPFKTDSLHRMFSVAKSFTSLAIGMLIADETIFPDDRVCAFFPEYVNEKTHPWIQELTIRHLLTMTTCHSKTTYNKFDDYDYAKSFFEVTPDHRPGTVFAYDTSASQVLCALVEKITKKKLLDYLREAFLDEIGFSKEAYMLTDPSGVSIGGSGLMCTLEDLTKVSVLLLNEGRHNGKQLIPAEYIRELSKKQVATDPYGSIDERNGYGYMFWRTRKPGYCMYGMGGQLALIFPEHKLVFTCIADTQGIAGGLIPLYDAFYSTIYEWASVKKWRPKDLGINDYDYVVGTVKGSKTSSFSDKLQNKTAIFCKNSMDIDKVRFDFVDNVLYLKTYDAEFSIPYGYNSFEHFLFPNSTQNAVASGAWVSDNQFLVRVQVMDEDLSPVIIEFGFGDNNAVTLRMKATNEPVILKKFAGIAGGTIED